MNTDWIPIRLSELYEQLVEFIINWYSCPALTRRVVWTTRRVNLHPMNTFCPRLAELMNNSSSSMKIALDSPSPFMHSPSTMNFQNNLLSPERWVTPRDSLKPFHTHLVLLTLTDMGQNPWTRRVGHIRSLKLRFLMYNTCPKDRSKPLNSI